MTRNLLLVAVAALVLAGCTAADASTSTVDPAPEQAPVESAMAKWEALPEFQQAGMCRLLLTDGEAYRANASSAEGYAMFDVMDEVCPTLTVSDVAESISPEVHWNLVAMGVSSVGPDGSPATTYELAGALAQAFYRSGPPSLDDLNVSFREPTGHIYQSLVTQGGMDFATYDRIFIAMRDIVRSVETEQPESDAASLESTGSPDVAVEREPVDVGGVDRPTHGEFYPLRDVSTGLYVRAYPSADADTVTEIGADSSVLVKCSIEDSAGNWWHRIVDPVVGYVSADYVDTYGVLHAECVTLADGAPFPAEGSSDFQAGWDYGVENPPTGSYANAGIGLHCEDRAPAGVSPDWTEGCMSGVWDNEDGGIPFDAERAWFNQSDLAKGEACAWYGSSDPDVSGDRTDLSESMASRGHSVQEVDEMWGVIQQECGL